MNNNQNYSTDMATVNIPLSKRGDINAQLDRWNEQQAKNATAIRKKNKAAFNENKAEAKAIWARDGKAMLDFYDGKYSRKALRDEFERNIKWEPATFLKMHAQYLVKAAAA